MADVVTDEDLLFVHSTTENEKVKSFDGGSFIICLIIAAFFLISLTSSFIIWHKKKEAKKAKKEKNISLTPEPERKNLSSPLIVKRDDNEEVVRRKARSGSVPPDPAKFRDEEDDTEEYDPDESQEAIHMPAKKEACCTRFMRCFSAVENMDQLWRPLSKEGDQELEVLNSVRVMACCIVILGNTYMHILRGPL